MNLRIKIRLFLVSQKDLILKISQNLVFLFSFLCVGSLIYYYGFPTDADTRSLLLNINRGFFGAFILNYVLKLTFSLNRAEFLKSSWLEAVFLSVIVINAIIFLLSQDGLIARTLARFSLDPISPVYALFIQLVLLILVLVEFARSSAILSAISLKPSTLLILSYSILISSGTGLLMLPAITNSGESLSLIDAFFTSVSASCITGLSVFDIPQTLNFKGQFIVFVLFQTGGLGILTFASFFASYIKKGVGIRQQAMIQELLDVESPMGTIGLVRRVLLFTFTIEAIGAVLVYFALADYPFANKTHHISTAVFHAVSAFCNAGFSNIPGGLMNPYTIQAYWLHWFLAALIIFGGLGFPAIRDITDRQNIAARLKMPWRTWKLSTQIAVYSSFVLIAFGIMAFMFLERSNTLERFNSLWAWISICFFQSVTTRTAGFNTVDIGSLTTSTLVIFMFLMFIGGSSGGTAGGIKTSTFVVIFKAIIATIRGRSIITMGRRTIHTQLIYKAFAIFIFSATFIFFCTFILTLTDGDKSILSLVFETISGFATVGLSTGITGELSDIGKMVISSCMFVGRVGVLTLAFALSTQRENKGFRYPNSHILIG